MSPLNPKELPADIAKCAARIVTNLSVVRTKTPTLGIPTIIQCSFQSFALRMEERKPVNENSWKVSLDSDNIFQERLADSSAC